MEEAAGRGAFQTRLWTVLAVSARDKKYSPGNVLSDICFLFSPFSRCLSFREPSKENFNNVPDLELNPIRSKIVRAFFDNRWVLFREHPMASDFVFGGGFCP